MNRKLIGFFLFGATCASALTSSIAARAQDPATVPGGERPPESRQIRPNRFLLGSGAVIVAASYTPAVIVAATSDRDGDKWLYAPVIGPWADLIDREGCAGDCTQEAFYKGLLVAGGIAHLVGVGAIVAAFFVPEERSPFAGTTRPTTGSVHVTPVAVRGGYGVGVAGRF